LISLVTIAMRRTRMADVVAEDAAAAPVETPQSEPIDDGAVTDAVQPESEPAAGEGPAGAARPEDDDSTEERGFPPTT